MFQRGAAAAVVLALVVAVTAFATRGGAASTGTGPAGLRSPSGFALRPDGAVIVADAGNNRVVSIKDGVTKLLAGAAKGEIGQNGSAAKLGLDYPASVAVARSGAVYIGEEGPNLIRRVFHGKLETVRDGGDVDLRAVALALVPASQPSAPWGVPGTLLVATTNSVFSTSAGGELSRVAGTGRPGYTEGPRPSAQAPLDNVEGIAVDRDGTVFIADGNNHRVRKVSPDGVISTVIGNGGNEHLADGMDATSGALYYPSDVALDTDGALYVLDAGRTVFRLNNDGTVSVVMHASDLDGFAGDGGRIAKARFGHDSPTRLLVGPDHSLYLLDTTNNRVRKVSPKGIVTTVG